MLVVWGTVGDGRLTLDPAFVVTGPPALPETEGPYRVEGVDRDGRNRFSLSFSPTPLEFGGGGFVFLVPYEPGWAEALDRMVLTGPEGIDVVTRNGSPPLAVVTDPSSGQIRAIVRNWDGGPLPGEGRRQGRGHTGDSDGLRGAKPPGYPLAILGQVADGRSHRRSFIVSDSDIQTLDQQVQLRFDGAQTASPCGLPTQGSHSALPRLRSAPLRSGRKLHSDLSDAGGDPPGSSRDCSPEPRAPRPMTP